VREEIREKIHQLMPAPGYRVWQGYSEDDGTAEVREIPVIGWAVFHRDLDDRDESDSSVIRLMVYEDGDVWSLNELNDGCDNAWAQAYAPGEDFNDSAKKSLEESARRTMGRRKKLRDEERAKYHKQQASCTETINSVAA
jgi:hypothetical protein